MKKIHRRKILVIAIITCFSIFVLTGYFIQKRNYPNPINCEYALGETFELAGFEITAKEMKHGTNKEICSEYALCNPVENLYFDSKWEDIYDCIIEVSIQNLSDSENSFPYYHTVISSETDSNGLDPDLFYNLNGNIHTVFQSGETKTVYFTYSLYNSTIQIKGDPFSEQKYWLVLQCYPEKYCIALS